MAYASLSETYDALRPGYPAGFVGDLLRKLDIGVGSIAVDVGAGTGKLSDCLRVLCCRVVAVEPLSEMRRLIPVHRDLHAVGALAERLPLRTGCADLVASGQAWHWFDPVPAVSAAHRVLRAGAPLLMLWNVWDTTVPWLARLQEFRRSYDADRSPAVDGDVIADWFDPACWTPLERSEAPQLHPVPGERLADLLLTSSVFADCDSEVEAALRTEVDAVAADHGLFDDQTLDIPYRTLAFWTRRC